MGKLVAAGSGVAWSSVHGDREETSFFRFVFNFLKSFGFSFHEMAQLELEICTLILYISVIYPRNFCNFEAESTLCYAVMFYNLSKLVFLVNTTLVYFKILLTNNLYNKDYVLL
jgi:hypothetical protein